MTYYPVIIPTLNRYQHFKDCVESLAACTHADKTELVIGLDYPPSEKYVEGWKQIKAYAPTIKGFKKVTVLEHDHNLDPRGNMECLRKYVSERYDAWIESEDDNVFSPCFLDYMDKCLERYKDDETVLAVSGYMYPIDYSSVGKDRVNVLRTQNFMPYGTGVWKRKLDEMFCNLPEHYVRYVCGHRKLLKKMRFNLRELYRLVFWSKSHPALDTKSDFVFSSYCIVNSKYVVSPLVSLTRNMGYDLSGENCKTDEWHSSQLISDETVFEVKDSPEEMSVAFACWNEAKKSIGFSENERKKILLYYYTYYIFGYNFAEALIPILKIVARPFIKLLRLGKKIVKTLVKLLFSFVKAIRFLYKYRFSAKFPKQIRILIQKNNLLIDELKRIVCNKTFHHVKQAYLDFLGEPQKTALVDYTALLIGALKKLNSIHFVFRGGLADCELLDFDVIKKICPAKDINFSFYLYLDEVERLADLQRLFAAFNSSCDSISFCYKVNGLNIYKINEFVAFADMHNKKIFYDLDISDTVFEKDEMAKRLAMEFFYKLFKTTGNTKYYALFLYLRDNTKYCCCPCKSNYMFTISSNENLSLCNVCAAYVYDLNWNGEKQLKIEIRKEKL